MLSNLTARVVRPITFLVAGLMFATACASRGPLSVSTIAGNRPSVVTGAQPMLVDTLANRLIAMEIERATARAKWEAWAPINRDLDARIGAVHEQLLATSTDAVTPRQVIRRVLDALDGRQAALAVTHRQLLTRYVPAAPDVMALAAEEQLLVERRAVLRVSLGLPAAAGASY